jgi:hypothetical protein
MSETLHAVSELRNRFVYNSESGDLYWRRVSFPEWARGKPRPSMKRYDLWLRTLGGQLVRPQKVNGVPVVLFRSRPYTLARLVWALHYGAHPPDDRYVVPANGDVLDMHSDNLLLLDSAGLRQYRASRKRGEVKGNRTHLPDPELLQTWLSYRDGELYYRPVPFEVYEARYRGASMDDYARWLKGSADRVLPTQGRVPRVQFGTRRYNKADMVFSVCRGFHLIAQADLVHADGDPKNCRIENLRVELPEGFDLDEDA